jgi:hypothetical protein
MGERRAVRAAAERAPNAGSVGLRIERIAGSPASSSGDCDTPHDPSEIAVQMAAPQEETDFKVHPAGSRECEWKDGRRELGPAAATSAH